jgi:hypothetical protein
MCVVLEGLAEAADWGPGMNLLKPLLVGLLVSLVLSAAHAEKRVALVIGNSNYANVRPLLNPEKDASAIAALFRSAGFDVVEARSNLNASAMRRAFRGFSDTARGSDIAVVYYAGHGIEVDGANYLLPTDAVLERDLDVEDEAFSVERVVRVLEPARRLRLIILDACRDNPFVRKMKRTVATRSIGRGLARVEPPSSDTLIAFAAKAGSTADDGDGAHSPFTDALLKYITTPGLDVRIAFGRVRDEVLTSTHNRQEPFVYGSLGGTTLSLVPATVVAAPAPSIEPAAPPVDPTAIARGDYEFASQVGTIKAWDSFLMAHPTGFYADLARAQRERINESRTAAVQPAPALEARKPTIDPAEVARLVHKELARLGCYPGDVNDSWGRPSRRAMELFNRNSGMKLDVSAANADTLDALRAKSERVCPRQREKKPAESASKPQREKKREAASAGRPQVERPKPQPSGAAKIMCGSTGCVTIRRGCRGEMRPAGRGEVAVEICG